MTELLMPKIGLTMEEGKVVEWRKNVGDRVEQGEVVFVFETEKTTFDVEAPHAGVLTRIIVDVEDTATVGSVVGVLEPADGAAVAAAAATTSAGSAASPPEPGGASPRARLVKLTGMRRLIAERMLASKRDAAQAYMVASIDASELLAAKERLAGRVESEARVHLTLSDLVVKVVAAAVELHPEVNAQWTPEGILVFEDVHVGIATAVEDGLLVPVVRDASRKTLAEIAAARAALVERARAGRLTPDESKGSTITISSLGMFGVEEFTAILNPPEAAILAVGAVVATPVAIATTVEVRPVMKVTLTYDHRVIDGALAAAFLQTLKERAQRPSALLGEAGSGR